MASSKSSFRGIFHRDEDPSYWKKATEGFPNGIPRFKEKADAVKFMESYCQYGSNPDEPHLRQSISTLTSWDQIQKRLIPKMEEYYSKWKPRIVDYEEISQKNVYMKGDTSEDVAEATPAAQAEYREKKEAAIKAHLKKSGSFWRQVRDTSSGKAYYYDKSTEKTSWKAPPELKGFVADWVASNPFPVSDASGTAAAHAVDSKGGAVRKYLQSRMNLPIHHRLTRHSSLNTLKYLFHHMRCGIFVMIRSNEVVIFCPFVNKDYRNNWAEVGAGLGKSAGDEDKEEKAEKTPSWSLQLDVPSGLAADYYASKEHNYRHENILPDHAQWWANGNIICNEHEQPIKAVDATESQSQYWGDHFLFQIKDMLCETCRLRKVPDCEFFINKRDYPQLKVNDLTDYSIGAAAGVSTDSAGDGSMKPGNLSRTAAENLVENMPVEPYGFIFDRDDRNHEEDIPLSRQLYRSYSPILSFYTSRRFADIPMPPSEDWESACGEIFPPSFHYTLDHSEPKPKPKVGNPRDLFTAANLKKFDCPWIDKVNTAFFRGGATGGGTSIETNQRLHLAQLGWDWNECAEPVKDKGVPLLDAKITGWNLRDKKIASRKMTYVRKQDFPFCGDREKNFVEIYKQSHYKYLIYVEGHCAACRYGFMMQLGCVILKVDSQCVADQMWYFPLLKPFYDHVPIKADLSDLREKIQWCIENDDKCKEIALNAKNLYKKYVSKSGVLDYMQSICMEISQKYVKPPAWLNGLPVSVPVPQPYTDRSTICCMPNCDDRCEHKVCATCDALMEKDRVIKAAAVTQAGMIKDTKAQRKQALRERSRMLAATSASNGTVGGQPESKRRRVS